MLSRWASELIAIKMQLRQVSWLLQQGVTLGHSEKVQLDRLIDRKVLLEKLIKEISKQD